MIQRIVLPGSELNKLRHINALLNKDNARLCALLNDLKEDFKIIGTIEEKYSDLKAENEMLREQLEEAKKHG